jgi:hypothetical protein
VNQRQRRLEDLREEFEMQGCQGHPVISVGDDSVVRVMVTSALLKDNPYSRNVILNKTFWKY